MTTQNSETMVNADIERLTAPFGRFELRDQCAEFSDKFRYREWPPEVSSVLLSG